MSGRSFTVAALIVALGLACVVSAWASGHPDGLEFVAESSGFLSSATDGLPAEGPAAGYEIAGIAEPRLTAALAGALGCAVVFGLACLMGRAAKRRPARGRAGA